MRAPTNMQDLSDYGWLDTGRDLYKQHAPRPSNVILAQSYIQVQPLSPHIQTPQPRPVSLTTAKIFLAYPAQK